MTDDRAGRDPSAHRQSAADSIPACLPAEWEAEVLQDHTAQIIFDPCSCVIVNHPRIPTRKKRHSTMRPRLFTTTSG